MTEIINGTLRMLGDRILLRPLDPDWKSSLVVIRHGRPVRGEALAVGPGIYPVSKRVKESPMRQRIEFSRYFRPTQVRVGEIIELGGLNIFDGKGYDFSTMGDVMYNGIHCLICTERDVAIVREDLRAA